MAPTANNKRGSRFIDRRVQGSLLARWLLYWIGYHVALVHAMFVCRLLSHRLDVVVGAPLIPLDQLYWSFLSDQQFLLFCAAAAFPIVARDMIAQTHRLVGPLVRFRRVLEQLKRGERVEAVRLRKGDLLVDFEKSFNEYLAWLNTRQDEWRDAGAPHERVAEETLLDEVTELRLELRPEESPAELSSAR